MINADDLYERLIRPIEKQMIRTVALIVRDPDAFEDKMKNPVYTEHDLKYMFLQDPGRQSFSASDR